MHSISLRSLCYSTPYSVLPATSLTCLRTMLWREYYKVARLNRHASPSRSRLFKHFFVSFISAFFSILFHLSPHSVSYYRCISKSVCVYTNLTIFIFFGSWVGWFLFCILMLFFFWKIFLILSMLLSKNLIKCKALNSFSEEHFTYWIKGASGGVMVSKLD